MPAAYPEEFRRDVVRVARKGPASLRSIQEVLPEWGSRRSDRVLALRPVPSFENRWLLTCLHERAYGRCCLAHDLGAGHQRSSREPASRGSIRRT